MLCNVSSAAQLRQESCVDIRLSHELPQGFLKTRSGRWDKFGELRWSSWCLVMEIRPVEGERCAVTLESWWQVDISRDNSSIQKRIHAIRDVILSDRRRVSERIISELLWQNSLRFLHFLVAALPNSELLKLYVTDSTLSSSILKLIRWRDTELLSDQIMAVAIFWITC